jgi:hypothetical protein
MLVNFVAQHGLRIALEKEGPNNINVPSLEYPTEKQVTLNLPDDNGYFGGTVNPENDQLVTSYHVYTKRGEVFVNTSKVTEDKTLELEGAHVRCERM